MANGRPGLLADPEEEMPEGAPVGMDPREAKRKLRQREITEGFTEGATEFATSPHPWAGPLDIPLRMAAAGAAAGAGVPETEPISEVGVYGKVAPAAVSALDTAGEVISGTIGKQYDLASRVMFGSGMERAKAAEKEAQGSHAHGAAAGARTDPASGTAQGAAQPYAGTGEIASKTAESGGVTTGAPGIRVDVPGRGMVDYDPDDPSVAEAFRQQGDDGFMEHRERAEPERVGQIRRPGGPVERFREVGPESPTGGHSWTRSSVPEAAQIENWDRYVKTREAEQQAFQTGMAEAGAGEAVAEAKTARADILVQEPFYAEELAAKAKLSEAQIQAATEIAGRERVMSVINGAAAQINEMRSAPEYAQLDAADRERLEDQIWDQARLALSALTETNLYPRPDPYAWMTGMGTPPPKEEAD